MSKPTGSVVDVKAARPSAPTAAVPRTEPLSVNVTVPVGAVAPGVAGPATVAVRVTVWPTVAVGGVAATVVVVATLPVGTATALENIDVSPVRGVAGDAASVAVAVTPVPPLTAGRPLTTKFATPFAPVVTATDPRNVWPSSPPSGLTVGLLNSSTR